MTGSVSDSNGAAQTDIHARYTAAVRWIESFIRPVSGVAPQKTPAEWDIEGPPRLARLDALLARLGHPERCYQTLHVTGTSGKGSVSTHLGAVLAASGLRAGLHTTPYLQVPTEKLQVGGSYPSPAEFAETVEAFRAAVGDDAGGLPYPALSVALTYFFFARAAVDAAVIEVGTGGRYDWTNTLHPAVSVITTVGPDHLTTLGPSLDDVAYHKAGVVKPGVPAVTGVRPPQLAVVEREARSRGSRLLRLGREFGYEAVRCTESCTRFDFVDLRSGERLPGLETGMLGRHQAFNAALAVAALRERGGSMHRVTENALRDGLRAARLPGRMELVQRSPDVLLDGAHNPEKAAALARSLAEIFPDRRLVLVLGALSTKDMRGIVAPFAAQTREVIVTTPHVLGKIGQDLDRLAGVVSELGMVVRTEHDPAAATRLAMASARPDDVICVTGSLYLVGEVRRLWVPDERVLDTGTSWPAAVPLAHRLIRG